MPSKRLDHHGIRSHYNGSAVLMSAPGVPARTRSVVILSIVALFFFAIHGAVLGFIFAAAAIGRGVYIHQKRAQATQRLAEEHERLQKVEALERKRREELAVTRGPRPSPTLIRTYRDAEEAAAKWMRWLGWGDASITPQGRDGGIDVMASHAIAQVKAHVNPIGRPEVQQLFGVATSVSRTPLFFASGGYTPQAILWADEVSMALFRFDLQGEPEPSNFIARDLWEKGAFPSPESSGSSDGH